jgi:hypothetical protein
MKSLVLKLEIIETIKKEPVLFGAVADMLGKSVFTLITLLRNNDPVLTQASVLRVLRNHLNIKKDIELLEEIEVIEFVGQK